MNRIFLSISTDIIFKEIYDRYSDPYANIILKFSKMSFVRNMKCWKCISNHGDVLNVFIRFCANRRSVKYVLRFLLFFFFNLALNARTKEQIRGDFRKQNSMVSKAFNELKNQKAITALD